MLITTLTVVKDILIVIEVTKKIMKKQRNKVQTSRSVAGDASIRLRPHDIPICKNAVKNFVPNYFNKIANVFLGHPSEGN